LVAIAAGAIAGVGLGFRADLLAVTALFPAVVLLLVPSNFTKQNQKFVFKIGVSFAFIAAFILASLPVLNAYQDESFLYTTFQRAEGIATDFNVKLELQPHYAYVADPYSDIIFVATVLGHAARSSGETSKSLPDAYVGRDYSRSLSRWSNAFYFDYAKLFPADVLTRTIRATGRVSTLPVKRSPNGLSRIPALNAAFANVFAAIAISGVFVFIAIALIGAENPRLALLFVLLLLFFGLVATIQFDPRHLFYLEPLFWIAVFTTVSLSRAKIIDIAKSRNFRSLIPGDWRELRSPPSFTIIPIALLIGMLATTAILFITREVQENRLESFLEQSLENRAATNYQLESMPDETTIVKFEEPEYLEEIVRGRGPSTPNNPADKREIATRYLGITFDPKICDPASGEVIIKYDNRPVFESVFDIEIRQSDNDPTILVFPAYFGNFEWFDGIILPTSLRGCLSEVFEIPTSDVNALAPFAELQPNWRDQRSHLGF